MELLAPARDFETLCAAFDAGADAAYLGLEKFSARMRARNFTPDDFLRATALKQKLGRKIYVTVNTLVREDELTELVETLAFLEAAGADAVIIQDYGVYRLIRELGINLPVHASTQMGTKNHVQARFLRGLGFRRAVLERQLTLGEIAAIGKHTPGLELEVFVHGALCFALSGCCFFSQELTGRSGNRGECAQPCRWSFGEHASKPAYPFSMKDLEGLSLLEDLKKAGVRSLKIEGRMKGVDYVYPVVSAYRKALDLLAKGRFSPGEARRLSAELAASSLSRRGGTGFFRLPRQASAVIGDDASGTGLLAGRATSVTATTLFFTTAVPLNIGDTIRIDDPKTDKRFKLPVKAIYLKNRSVREVPPGSTIGVPSPHRQVKPGAGVYLVHRRSAYRPSAKPPPPAVIADAWRTRASALVARYKSLYPDERPSPVIDTVTFTPDCYKYAVGGKSIRFVPPSVYEADVAQYDALVFHGTDGVFISHPCEAALASGTPIYGSPFLYAVNKPAVRFFRELGIQGLSVCPDCDSRTFALIAGGVERWFRWTGLPLWVTRVPMADGTHRLATKRSVVASVRGTWGTKGG